MGDIRLSIGQVNIPNYLRINAREVGNPSVIVAFHVEPPPVPASFNIIFPGVADVVHYIDFRMANDAISQGLLLGTFVYDVKNEVVVSEMRFYTVDGFGPNDPTSSDSGINDPYLDGKIVSTVYKEGFRPLQPGVEFEQVGAQINFLTPPLQVLGADEKLVVEIVYKTVVASGSAGAFPADIIEITADTTLADIHQNKLMEVNGSTTTVEITLPPFTTIPEGTKYAFSSEPGSQMNVAIVIDPLAVNYALVGKEQRTTLYLGKGEYISIMKKGSFMRVLEWRGDYARVGELVYSDIAPLNSVAHQGLWDDIADYPRLYEWYISELDPSFLGSGTYPSTPLGVSRHKWCIDLVNQKIWFPDFGGLFLRVTDADGNIDTERPSGDRKPGTYQDFAIQSHSHFIFYDNGNVSNKIALNSFNYPVRRQGGGVDVGNNNYEYSICADNSNQPNIGRSSATGSVETRPRNLNMNVYRII